MPNLVKGMVDKFFGNKGYVYQKLFENLFAQGLVLVNSIR